MAAVPNNKGEFVTARGVMEQRFDEFIPMKVAHVPTAKLALASLSLAPSPIDCTLKELSMHIIRFFHSLGKF